MNTPTQYRKEDMSVIVQKLIGSGVSKGTSLLYLASGRRVNRFVYENLDYDNIILVDRCFRAEVGVVGSKIITIGMDAIPAVKALGIAGAKISAVVTLCEGLFEGGGGQYLIQGDNFMGYLLPIMADSFIHISRKEYYWANSPSDYMQDMKRYHMVKHWMDVSYEKVKELTDDNPLHISPQLFVENNRNALGATVTLLSRRSTKQHSFNYKGLLVNIKHRSIWADVDILDMSFVRYDSDFQRREIEKVEKNVLPIYHLRRIRNGVNLEVDKPNYKQYNTNDIIGVCKESGARSIGVVPHGGNYLKMIDEIASSGVVDEINFYHLNSGDYSSLYALS